MTREEARAIVIDALRAVAPESDPDAIDGGAALRDALDLDSMDFLNFVIAVHARAAVDIPEADYAKLRTLESAVAYVATRAQ